ncbi:hypothetical protein CP02DC14_2370, partial [Chlamydia psittaci 02DC14]
VYFEFNTSSLSLGLSQEKYSSLFFLVSFTPVGMPLYPSDTTYLFLFTMQAPTLVLGSFDLKADNFANAIKYASHLILFLSVNIS